MHREKNNKENNIVFRVEQPASPDINLNTLNNGLAVDWKHLLRYPVYSRWGAEATPVVSSQFKLTGIY